MHRAQALYTALEHEAMHQETLLYMWHRLAYDKKTRSVVRDAGSDGLRIADRGSRTGAAVRIPSGTATLGADRNRITFGWDNEFDQHQIEVPAFEMDVDNVTNGEFLEFIEAGGYRSRQWWSDEHWQWLQENGITQPAFWTASQTGRAWIGMFETISLPLDWPVYVSHAEATAYATWKGRRLPSEAEYHRAAFGTPEGREQSYPWGEAAP
jgi:formylglycine-generating enzyme required for sulfatase activity